PSNENTALIAINRINFSMSNSNKSLYLTHDRLTFSIDLRIPYPGSISIWYADICILVRHTHDFALKFSENPSTCRSLLCFNIPYMIALTLCFLTIFVKSRNVPLIPKVILNFSQWQCLFCISL